MHTLIKHLKYTSKIYILQLACQGHCGAVGMVVHLLFHQCILLSPAIVKWN